MVEAESIHLAGPFVCSKKTLEVMDQYVKFGWPVLGSQRELEALLSICFT